MSYINFLIKGTNGIQDSYKKDTYQENSKIHYSGNVANFQGNIRIINQDDKTKTLMIDEVFKITTLSDKVLEGSRKIWEDLQKNTKITFIVTLIGGLAGLVAAVAVGLLNPALIVSAIGVGIVALVILGVSFLALKRNREAKNELNKWADPLNDLITQCENLNRRLKAEEKMKVEIESKINEGYQKILNLIGKGNLYQMLVQNEIQSLAFDIHTIWTNHTLELLKEYGVEIPRNKIFKILDPYIQEFPLLQDVKNLLTSV